MNGLSGHDEAALWVFGYGSLIWNPGFAAIRREIGLLRDHHRSFCMDSVHYRGTEAEPGLVLALDRLPGSSCQGVAFGVAAPDAEATLAALRVRELTLSAYREVWVPVHLRSGGVVEAVTYVIDRDHALYRGGLSLEEQAGIIARARGDRGPNREYLANTVAHLRDLDLSEPDLDRLAEWVGKMPTG